MNMRGSQQGGTKSSGRGVKENDPYKLKAQEEKEVDTHEQKRVTCEVGDRQTVKSIARLSSPSPLKSVASCMYRVWSRSRSPAFSNLPEDAARRKRRCQRFEAYLARSGVRLFVTSESPNRNEAVFEANKVVDDNSIRRLEENDERWYVLYTENSRRKTCSRNAGAPVEENLWTVEGMEYMHPPQWDLPFIVLLSTLSARGYNGH